MTQPRQLTAPEKDAFELLRLNYFVVNRKHQIVGCFPKGKNGTQSLGEASGNANWANQISEGDAGDQYLRIYGFEAGMWMALDDATFSAFIRAGGRRYNEPVKGVKR